MPALPALLIAASALVIGALGSMHLWLTFHGNAFHPRDASLKARLEEVSPVITRQTTMWRAWIGFNASHSFGAILFALVYGYLALLQAPVLFGSPFLLAVGLSMLAGFAFLGHRYWFSVPYRGILLATAFYVAALVTHWV